MWEIKKKLGANPLSKLEIVRRCSQYEAVDIYCYLYMEEKLATASYNSPKELLNQRSETLDIC